MKHSIELGITKQQIVRIDASIKVREVVEAIPVRMKKNVQPKTYQI